MAMLGMACMAVRKAADGGVWVSCPSAQTPAEFAACWRRELRRGGGVLIAGGRGGGVGVAETGGGGEYGKRCTQSATSVREADWVSLAAR